MWLYLNIAVRSWFYMALLLLPGSLMIGASELFTRGNPSSLDRIMAVMGMAMGICLLILGGITGWIFTRRYSLAPYLVIRKDSLTARQAIQAVHPGHPRLQDQLRLVPVQLCPLVAALDADAAAVLHCSLCLGLQCPLCPHPAGGPGG